MFMEQFCLIINKGFFMGTYSSKVNEDELTFLFVGEMDTLTCVENEERILSLIMEHKGKVVFDLKEVIYISSSLMSLEEI